MTESAAWRPVGTVDPTQLVEARNQAHHALQIPAMAATAYVPFREDYSHINFGWADQFSAFVSHDVPTEQGTVQFGIRLADLTLLILVDGAIRSSYPMHGKTNGEAKAWLLSEVAALGLAAEKFDAVSPSEIPDHPVAAGAPYDVETHDQAMAEFCNYYGNANLVLAAIRESYLDIKPGPNEIRMWPHHFDIAVLVTLEEGDSETAKAFGFGFEPGDASCEQPYFYTYPWPRDYRPESLPPLSGVGQWTQPDTWLGTLLVGADIAVVSADQQQGTVAAYLREASDHCRTLAIQHP